MLYEIERNQTNQSQAAILRDQLTSVIIPVFNEERTIHQILQRVVDLSFAKEVIVVDDGSTDSTPQQLADWERNSKVRLLTHTKNQGKGSAIRTGIICSTGAYAVIQDADLEYAPEDLLLSLIHI